MIKKLWVQAKKEKELNRGADNDTWESLEKFFEVVHWKDVDKEHWILYYQEIDES